MTMANAANSAAVDAVHDAFVHTKEQLFPFRFDRWLPLGFVAFLDQCGRHGGGASNLRLPNLGGGGPSGGGKGGSGIDLDQVRAWVGEHLVLIVVGATLLFAFVVGITVLVTWLRSRGTFMYIDNVSKGTFDVARPWREHREIASSFFAWQLAIKLASLVGVLALAAPALFSFFYLLASRNWWALIGIVIPILMLIVMAVIVGLISVASRDFIAPLQFRAELSFRGGFDVLWGLLREHPLAFVIYLLIKVIYAILAGLVAILACCLTCCCAILPVVNQTLLQPVYYFERSWSLFFLRRLGHDVFPGGSRS